MNPTFAQLESIEIKAVMGDALNVAEVEQAILGDEPIHAAISTIGGLPKDSEKADYLGNKNLIDAVVKAGVNLKPVLIEKEKAEKYLIDSGLAYTIIRPGGLKSEPATIVGMYQSTVKVVFARLK